MSKTNSSKSAKPAKSNILTKAKDAAVTKPAQSVKAKSKELAKQVVAKEDKKSKKSKKVKEPTPEPSESEESVSSESESSASESEEDTKPVVNGKANGAKKSVAPPQDDSDSDESESDSDSAESSEDEAPKANGANKKVAAVTNKTVKPTDDSDSDDSASASDSDSDVSADESAPVAKAASSDEDSDESADDSSEDEKPAAKPKGKAVDIKKSVKATADSDSEEDSDDSDSSEESDEEETEKPAPKSVKRKAEDEDGQLVKKTKTAAVDTSRGANLFVGNLSWNVDEAWLKEVFEEYGELAGVRVMTDRDTGRSKGFGYVEFTSAEDAANAHAAKQGFELDGRTLNVDYAAARPDNSQRQETRRKSYGDQVSEPSDTLFIGNLSFDVGQEAVTEAFQPHGTILGIRLPTDRETGQPKGFGYVTFASVEEASSALEAMNGAYIESRPIRLDYSQPRPQNGDSPARGRGGFRGGPRGGARGGRGGRGGSFGGGFGGRGGRGGGRGGSTNRGGFGDFSGKKINFG